MSIMTNAEAKTFRPICKSLTDVRSRQPNNRGPVPGVSRIRRETSRPKKPSKTAKHPSVEQESSWKRPTRVKDSSLTMIGSSGMVEAGAERSGQEPVTDPEVPPHGSPGPPSR